MSDSTLRTVIEILCTVGGASHLEPDQDYYEAGVTSVQALPLLLEMEDRFQVSIPDDRFISTRTARGLVQVIEDLKNS